MEIVLVLPDCRAVFPLNGPDSGVPKQAVDFWHTSGVWVKKRDGSFKWYPPHAIVSASVSPGAWGEKAFNRFQTDECADYVENGVTVLAATRVTCPFCGVEMVPGTIERGPTAGQPKCSACGKNLRTANHG